MPASMARGYCHVCGVDYYTRAAWLHRQSKSHKRKVNERYPLPPNPWAPKPDNKILPRKLMQPLYRASKP